MKRTVFILLCLFPLLASCSDKMGSDSMSLIQISSETLSTKVEILEDTTVWNYKDRVGIFFENGTPEQWTYLGEDKAVSGNIGGITNHSLSEKKMGLFPYSNKARLDGNAVLTSINGNPVLVSVSNDDKLCFKYACSCIALRIKGSGELKDIELKSLGGESISGDISIDLSGQNPVVSLVKGGSDSLSKDVDISLSSSEKEVYFYLPPVCMASGFCVDCCFTDSLHRQYNFPSSLELIRGNAYIYDLRVECLEEDIWDFDFRYENALELPVLYSKGVFNSDTGYPEGKTFRTADGKELTFYTVDGKDDKGTLGVKYTTTSGTEPYNWMQMGRADSYIKIHGREGYSIRGVSLTPRGSAGAPYFSRTPDGYSSISAKYYAMTTGEEFYVPLSGLEDGESCYMMVNTTMVSLFRMQVKYVSLKNE